MSQKRLGYRRRSVRLTVRTLRREGVRMRAWQHKLYEAPLMWWAGDRGIVIAAGAAGWDGEELGYVLCRTRDQMRTLRTVLRRQAPLDRSADRWGVGEAMDRVWESLISAGLPCVQWREACSVMHGADRESIEEPHQ
jgi:hypothetical protein